MKALIILSIFSPINNANFGYITGALLALFVLAYLVYALFKPEKF